MKRALLLILLLMFVFELAACNGNNSFDNKVAEDVTTTVNDTTETSDTAALNDDHAVDNKTAIKNALSANGVVDSVEECPEIEGYEDIVYYWTLTAANGLDIDLTFYLPADFQSGKIPAMICEPLNIQDDHERFAEAAEKGVAVILVFNGRSGVADLGGDGDMSYLSTAVDLIYGGDFIDTEKVMLFGASNFNSVDVLRYISEDTEGKKPVTAAALVNPVHDMYKYYENLDDQWKEILTRYAKGTPEEAPEEFEKRSPGLLAENVNVPLYIAYFDIPADGEVVNGIKKSGIPDISYYDEYIGKLNSLGKDVTAVHYDSVANDLDHDQFIAMAEWFLGLE